MKYKKQYKIEKSQVLAKEHKMQLMCPIDWLFNICRTKSICLLFWKAKFRIQPNYLGFDSPIRSQLIKLNIYPQGGLFKKHVDSPKLTAVGSLVVFLPCKFDGGELIVQKKQKKNVYSFGNQKGNTISWAAFYNDCVHQITEVTAGNRLTLSYNLFLDNMPITKGKEPNNNIVQLLCNLDKGRTYAYHCQHFYGKRALKQSANHS